MVYFRHLPTFQLLGIQFGVSESTANEPFNYWLPNLREGLPSSLLEQVKKTASDSELVKELLTEYEFIVDSYEQVRERPREHNEQKKDFSGKTRNHTFKSQMISLPNGSDIVDVIAGEPGSKNAITLFREYRLAFDPQQRLKGDKADIGEDLITTPMKKPRNRELTTEQKAQKKALSAKQIFVKHRIRSVKIFRVIQERFRLNPQKHERVMLTIYSNRSIV